MLLSILIEFIDSNRL